MHDLVVYEALARGVRAAILAVPTEERPIVLQDFPHGACGWSSLLLGAILKDRGHTGFIYVCGERPSLDPSKTSSHAWLERGSLIIDITADQFPDSPAPIVVSLNSQWHATFEREHIEPSDFRESLGPALYPLLSLYSRVARQLNAT